MVFCDVRGVSVNVSSDLLCYTFRSNLSLSYRVILVLWNTAWFSVDVAARVRSCQMIFHLCSHYWWQLTNLLKSLQVLSCWKIRASICFSQLLNGETSFPSPPFWHMKQSVQFISLPCTDSASGKTNINFRLDILKHKYRGVLVLFVTSSEAWPWWW